MIPADIEPVIAENIRARQACGAARLSLDGLTQAQFAAEYPGADMATLTNDQEFMRQVERYAAIPAVQEYALEAQLRRGLSESVTGLVNKIQAPDASGTALCAASDALTKISNLLDRRETVKREGGEQGLIRWMLKSWSTVTIKTIEGITEFECSELNTHEDTVKALQAMRCTTNDEVEQVITAMRSKNPMVVLNLRGF